jgi:predicted phage tail component-like protein
VASYTFIYNGVNLSNLVRVRAVNTTVLPPRENNAITIWERTGSIYNSYRYGERDISVTFLIRATASEYRNNPNCMENKLNTLRNVFKVSEPKPLYLGTADRYIYAVPEGDFMMTEIRYDCYECEIQFVCHNPEYYSASVRANTNSNRSTTYGMRNSSNNNTIEVYNGGNASAYPIINIGINEPTSFVQVENTTNGNKFLLGSYPKAGMDTSPKSPIVANYDMSNAQDWIATPMVSINGNNVLCLDSNRDYQGTVKNTEDGSGIMIKDAATGSSLWHGAGARQRIDLKPTNFELKAMLHLNSYGVGGDPTEPQYKDGAINLNDIEYFYKVAAPSVPIRATQEIYGAIIGSCNKGDYVFPSDVSNGWLQVDGGWCEAVYFKKYIADSSTTYVAMNVAVNAEDIELWSRPSDDTSDSLLLATIPGITDSGRTILRVHSELVNNKYYKLYIPYNGKVGYIDSSKVVDAYDVPIEYPEEEIIVSDDNKTGICEVYGYSDKGTKLFKLCLSDENPYYSFVTPTIYIGDNKVLEDITTVSTNSKADIDEYNVGYDALSENTCDWNNFYGELGIRREDNKWQAWIYKIENGIPVKKLIFKEQEVSSASSEPLHYIVVYMGAQDPSNMCGISINNIQVNTIHDDSTLSGQNIAPFNQGDEIKIDCYNNKVYLNNKLYNDIDMGSQFIELLTGNNILKVASEDPTMLATVLFNERYL